MTAGKATITAAEYAQNLAGWGLGFGVVCEHNGLINEGAQFMFIAPADPPWVYALVLRGDMNQFTEGSPIIRKIHCGLRPVEA